MAYILKTGNYIQYGKKIIPARSLQLLAEECFDAQTTSSTASTVGTMEILNVSVGDTIIVDIVDNAGRRTNYFYEHLDTILIDEGSNTVGLYIIYDSSGDLKKASSSFGVSVGAANYADDILTLTISQKYSATYKTIDGNYRVRVYKAVL